MLSETEVLNKVIELAGEQVGVDPSEITRDTHYINDLNFDSLDVVEHAMELEDTFEISIPDEEAQRIQTIGQTVEYVLKSLSGVPKSTA